MLNNKKLTYLPTDNQGLLETIQNEIKHIYGVSLGNEDIVHISLLNTLIQIRERSNKVIESNIALIASLQAKEDKEKNLLYQGNRINELLKEV